MHTIFNRKCECFIYKIFYIQDKLYKKYLLNADFVPGPVLGIERKQWKKQIRHNLLDICI